MLTPFMINDYNKGSIVKFRDRSLLMARLISSIAYANNIQLIDCRP